MEVCVFVGGGCTGGSMHREGKQRGEVRWEKLSCCVSSGKALWLCGACGRRESSVSFSEAWSCVFRFGWRGLFGSEAGDLGEGVTKSQEILNMVRSLRRRSRLEAA
eukprot:2116777-Rhodomonas_salina.1